MIFRAAPLVILLAGCAATGGERQKSIAEIDFDLFTQWCNSAGGVVVMRGFSPVRRVPRKGDYYCASRDEVRGILEAL